MIRIMTIDGGKVDSRCRVSYARGSIQAITSSGGSGKSILLSSLQGNLPALIGPPQLPLPGHVDLFTSSSEKNRSHRHFFPISSLDLDFNASSLPRSSCHLTHQSDTSHIPLPPHTSITMGKESFSDGKRPRTPCCARAPMASLL